MTTEWVRVMMVKWGEWTASGQRRLSGSGSAYPAYQMVHIRGTGGGELPIDMDVMEVDAIMGRIKVSQPKLYWVAYEVYVQGMSHQTVAGRLRCHRDTVYARLNSAHKVVADQVMERRKKRAATNGETFLKDCSS